MIEVIEAVVGQRMKGVFIMKVKKLIALLAVLTMLVGMTACSGRTEANEDSDMVDSKGQIAVGREGDVEVNEASEHLDAVEASESGNWEAMFVPLDDETRNIDMLDFDLAPTEEELEAMKKEPYYDTPVKYMEFGGCSAGSNVADYMGYFEEAGVKVEGYKSDYYVEALGSNQAQVCISHIATMLVPITNGVDIKFVGGAHLACKSLYALADSPYKTTEDLKGTNVSVPNGIGASDYNITSLMLDDDGIDPAKDLTLVQVTADACVAAMENGEISAALLSDVYAYGLVKEGKLRCVSSMLDSDFSEIGICCAIAMNGTFVKENPVIAKKMYQAIQKAHCYMREKLDDSVDMMLGRELLSGDREMNIMINRSQQYGLTPEFTEANLREIIRRYIRLGLIDQMDDEEAIMALCWNPVK